MRMPIIKTLSLAVIGLLLHTTLQAQVRYFTRTGEISFYSETPMEKIEAHNYKVTSVWDVSTGAIEFAALIKAFEFEKALMQEHFNENYMESGKFPNAKFKGTLTGLSAEGITKPGTYPVTVEGELTIHGVTRQVKEPGTVTVDPTGKVSASCDLVVAPEDHDISIPSVVKDKIAKEVEVKVRMEYQKM